MMLSRQSTFSAFVLILVPITAAAQQYIANGPCASLCSSDQPGTQADNVVCLDGNWTSTTSGNNFRQCIGCQLNSTAVDTATNTTDVEWALFKLRYTLSECMFGFPEQVVSISNPCQVTCTPLSPAISLNLSNSTDGASPDLSYCQVGNFSDTTINNCAFCYGFVPQQLFLANFLQALHTACLNPPVPGQVFYPDGPTVFNESLIPGPVAQGPPSASHGGIHGWELAIAIVLPVIAGLLLTAGGCFGLYVFTTRRREKQEKSGRMDRVTKRWSATNAYSPVTPKAPQERWEDNQQMQELDRISPGQRWSGQLQDHSPAKGTFTATEIVGPGDGQVQDHNLHERYFGDSSPGIDEEEAERRARIGLGVSDDEDYVVAGPSTMPEHVQASRQYVQDERGEWV